MHSRTGSLLALVLLFAALLGACGSNPPAPVSAPGYEQRVAKNVPARYTVQRGDTLYSIAWRFGIDYRNLADWNRVSPPYLIHPGRTLRLKPPTSGSTSQVATRPLKRSGSTADKTSQREVKPANVAKKGKKTKKKQEFRGTPSAKIQWRWPTSGVPEASGKGRRNSLKIPGRKGQPIYSTGPGQIVYIGSGLRGYGELIIVKHNKSYLSAYGHNRKLLVQEGQQVRGGQQIAEMGSTEAPRPMLHFEIRLNGKPIDPMRLLPRR